MLKHVEQSVAAAALRWFRANEKGLAAMYAPHAQMDAQFRGRLKLLRDHHVAYSVAVEDTDPDTWPTDVVLGAFQASVMLKDALDAAGPILLRRTHEVLGRAALARGLPILDPRAVQAERARRVAPKPRKTDRRKKKGRH